EIGIIDNLKTGTHIPIAKYIAAAQAKANLGCGVRTGETRQPKSHIIHSDFRFKHHQTNLRLTIPSAKVMTVPEHDRNHAHTAAHKFALVFHAKMDIPYGSGDISLLGNPIEGFARSTETYTEAFSKITHWQSNLGTDTNTMKAFFLCISYPYNT